MNVASKHALAVALAVAGCSKDRPPPPAVAAPSASSLRQEVQTTAPSASVSSAPEPAASAVQPEAAPRELTVVPTVGTMQDDEVPADGFPAISDDGKLVALAERREDGGRGHPNLTVSIRKVEDDSAAWSLVVLTSDEWDKKGNAGNPEKPALFRAMKERIAKANAKLAASTWRPMRLGDAQPDAMTACRDKLTSQRAEIAGVGVTLDGTKLRVRPPGAPTFERDVAAWTFKGKPECVGRNAMKLDRIHADPGRGALVVRVEYCGDDTCWEPDAQWHAMRLRP